MNLNHRWFNIDSLKHIISHIYTHSLFWLGLFGLILRFSFPLSLHMPEIFQFGLEEQ